MTFLVIIAVILFLLSGAALAYVVGATAVLAFIATDNVRYLAVLPQRIFSQLDVFALMAMSLFIATGEIMNQTGVTRALIDFSMSLVGRFKGGLGHVNIATNLFFAGVSGSAVADAAALSATLVPAMREKGYSNLYSGAITAAASIIGPIIPPSIVMIFYGALMQASVGGLFMAGIIPGFMLAAVLMLANSYFAHRHGHPGGRGTVLPPFWPSLLRALPALCLPVIILGGIVFGVVTPTEAAAVAVVAAIAAGRMYGEVSLKLIIGSLQRSARLTGSIFLILATAACVAYIGSLERWPQMVAQWAGATGLTGVSFLILVNFVFLIAGMFMEVPLALALLVPLFGPACQAQGIHPIHLGIVLCLNLTIGMVTPPIGACLVVVSTIIEENYWALARTTMPFVLLEVIILALVTFVPQITLWLPGLTGFL